MVDRPAFIRLVPRANRRPTSSLHVALVVAQAAFGVIVLAAALHGYLFAPLKHWHKGVLLLATIGLIYPDWRASVPAVAAVLFVILLQRMMTPVSEGTGPG